MLRLDFCFELEPEDINENEVSCFPGWSVVTVEPWWDERWHLLISPVSGWRNNELSCYRGQLMPGCHTSILSIDHFRRTQSLLCFSPSDCWDRLQAPPTTLNRTKRQVTDKGWMNDLYILLERKSLLLPLSSLYLLSAEFTVCAAVTRCSRYYWGVCSRNGGRLKVSSITPGLCRVNTRRCDCLESRWEWISDQSWLQRMTSSLWPAACFMEERVCSESTAPYFKFIQYRMQLHLGTAATTIFILSLKVSVSCFISIFMPFSVIIRHQREALFQNFNKTLIW